MSGTVSECLSYCTLSDNFINKLDGCIKILLIHIKDMVANIPAKTNDLTWDRYIEKLYKSNPRIYDYNTTQMIMNKNELKRGPYLLPDDPERKSHFTFRSYGTIDSLANKILKSVFQACIVEYIFAMADEQPGNMFTSDQFTDHDLKICVVWNIVSKKKDYELIADYNQIYMAKWDEFRTVLCAAIFTTCELMVKANVVSSKVLNKIDKNGSSKMFVDFFNMFKSLIAIIALELGISIYTDPRKVTYNDIIGVFDKYLALIGIESDDYTRDFYGWMHRMQNSIYLDEKAKNQIKASNRKKKPKKE